MAIIRLSKVGLTFRVRRDRKPTLKEFVLKGLFRPSINPIMEVPALKDIDLEVVEGERVGIVGHNGAGKSTLLKVLAGVYPPTRGKRHVEGQISSLFDLILGFEMEGSGWDNIRYRGYLQGESPKSIEAKMEAISEFSGLGEFLSTPVKYYSSGMMVRLAFAISTAVDPEILLVDEVLSAGDLAFQKKARARMLQMIDRARLFVMVSHDITSLGDFCNRGIWLQNGQIRMDGEIDEVLDLYERDMKRKRREEEERERLAA